MKTTALYLPPETLLGHVIVYHPFCDLLCAGGQVDEGGAITWLVPQYEPGSQCDIIPKIPTPAVNENIIQNKATHPCYHPTKPEFLLPLNSIFCVKFSPDGRFLAVLGPDNDKDRLFVYEVMLPSKYSDIDNKLLRTFLRLDLKQSFLNELSWSPDSSFIAVGTQMGQVVIIPIRTHIPINNFDDDRIRASNSVLQIKCVSGAVMGLSWSHDGYLIAVQGYQEIQLLVKKIQKNKVTFQKGVKFSKSGFIYQDDKWIDSPNQQDAYLIKGIEKYSIEQKSLRTFYAIALYKRQCAFSPDSSFLISTSGSRPVFTQNCNIASLTLCTYVFAKQQLCQQNHTPSIILGGLRAPSVAVAFSPVLYELDDSKPNISDLQYRMLFAIAAGCDAILYDTQNFSPLFIFEGESFQLDYLISVSFNATGSQLCTFGAYFQYQFFDLPESQFKKLSVKLQNYKFETILLNQAIAKQKAQYVSKLNDYNSQKIKTKPSKPVQIQLNEINCDKRVKIYTVSELYQYDLQTAPLLQITNDEVKYIEQLISNQEEQNIIINENLEQEVDKKE